MNFIVHFIYGIILPIDFNIFQRGKYTTNQSLLLTIINHIYSNHHH